MDRWKNFWYAIGHLQTVNNNFLAYLFAFLIYINKSIETIKFKLNFKKKTYKLFIRYLFV